MARSVLRQLWHCVDVVGHAVFRSFAEDDSKLGQEKDTVFSLAIFCQSNFLSDWSQ